MTIFGASSRVLIPGSKVLCLPYSVTAETQLQQLSAAAVDLTKHDVNYSCAIS